MPEHVLRSPLEQARGVIGRYPRPAQRYVFPFDSASPRLVHMLGVHRPLRVTWYAHNTVVAECVLRPWIGWGRYRADRIVEERP